ANAPRPKLEPIPVPSVKLTPCRPFVPSHTVSNSIASRRGTTRGCTGPGLGGGGADAMSLSACSRCLLRDGPTWSRVATPARTWATSRGRPVETRQRRRDDPTERIHQRFFLAFFFTEVFAAFFGADVCTGFAAFFNSGFRSTPNVFASFGTWVGAAHVEARVRATSSQVSIRKTSIAVFAFGNSSSDMSPHRSTKSTSAGSFSAFTRARNAFLSAGSAC